jgi:hypothetical protein
MVAICMAAPSALTGADDRITSSASSQIADLAIGTHRPAGHITYVQGPTDWGQGEFQRMCRMGCQISYGECIQSARDWTQACRRNEGWGEGMGYCVEEHVLRRQDCFAEVQSCYEKCQF